MRCLTSHPLIRVYNILNHEKEADRILYEDPHPETGFLILPDLKWDRKTISTLVSLVFAVSVSSRSRCLLFAVLVRHRLRQIDQIIARSCKATSSALAEHQEVFGRRRQAELWPGTQSGPAVRALST
jgi:hypothetical protein